MKFLLLIALLAFSGQAAQGVDEELRQCVQKYEQAADHYRHQFPGILQKLEPRLANMAERASIMKLNLDAVLKNEANVIVDKFEAHLVANALVSCKQELEHFEHTVKSFRLFVLSSFCSMGLALVLSLVWWVMRKSKPPASEGSQSDKPVSKRLAKTP